jgi:multidrug efflux pump subunit AcrB/outer membrane protein TolC
MLADLYSKPLRVYLLVALLSGLGVWAGLGLPISLYPQTTQPMLTVNVGYGSLSAQEFRKSYGAGLEGQLQNFRSEDLNVENVSASYDQGSAQYNLDFRWGQDAQKAEDQLGTRMASIASAWPEEIRDSIGVWQRQNSQGGFLAISFYSETREIGEVYRILRDSVGSKLDGIPDLGSHWLQNPGMRQVQITLDAAKMVAFGVGVNQVEAVIKSSLRGLRAGSLQVGENSLSIEVPPLLEDLADFGKLSIALPGNKIVPLSQVAAISLQKAGDQNIFKTDGQRSLILFATPKAGANVKQMAEDIMAIVTKAQKTLPADIVMKTLVDPSEFIRSSVRNVMREVAIGAGLASIILFLFIGSFRNVATAAIEIPVSLVLAFLMMRISGMSVNLISLGGLALSAGMNVDASVVVMENIFRRLEEWKGSFDERSRTQVVIGAVKEVWIPVVSATFASLVVFIPLMFTQSLAQAVLGDLAKAVIFSHGFSCFVALILVPTVRLHLMRGQTHYEAPKSPIEGFWSRVEQGYSAVLGAFVRNKVAAAGAVISALLAVVGLGLFIIPKLPKEVVGLPESDFVVVRVNVRGFMTSKQVETVCDGVELRVKEALGPIQDYNFNQIFESSCSLLVRISSRKQVDAAIRKLEETIKDTPELRFRIQPWNPSELPIPNPPQLEIQVTGGTASEQFFVATDVYNWLQGTKFYPRVYSDVKLDPGSKALLWKPMPELTAGLSGAAGSGSWGISEIVRFLSLASDPRKIGDWLFQDDTLAVRMDVDKSAFKSVRELEGVPIRMGEKIIPLSTFGSMQVEQAKPPMYFVEGEQLLSVYGRYGKGQEAQGRQKLAEAKSGFETLRAQRKDSWPAAVTADFVESERELNQAIHQITVALGWSVGLIALILLLQFGSILEMLLVLVAIPLGFIGAFLSLWAFGSTLSLNSVLGIILLNGLAVGNSIILVDFMNRLSQSGLSPVQAAQEAARQRLRPILITSLTTILGMLPIALGAGEGGKVLQPLGISVAGGLWVSMALTLFLVPALHVWLLERRNRKHRPGQGSSTGSAVSVTTLFCVGFGALLLAQPAHAKDAANGGVHRDWIAWLERAVSEAPEVIEAAAQLSAAKTQLRQRDPVRDFLPNVTAFGDARRGLETNRIPFAGKDNGDAGGDSATAGTTKYTKGSLGAEAKVNLFNGGRDASQRQESQAQIRIAEAGLLQATLSATERLSMLAVEFSQLRNRSLKLPQRLELLERNRTVAQLRFERGQLARADVERVLRQIISVSGEMEDSKAKLEQAKVGLETATPQAAKEELGRAYARDWASTSSTVTLSFLKNLTGYTSPVEVQPKLVALKAESDKIGLQRDRLGMSNQLKLDAALQGTLDRPWDPAGDTSYASQAVLSLSLPLYDRGMDALELEVLSSRLQVIRSQVTRFEQESQVKRKELVGRIQVGLSRLQRTEKMAASAALALAAEQKRFQEGRISFFELLSDALELWSLEDRLLSDSAEVESAWARLCSVDGRTLGDCYFASL